MFNLEKTISILIIILVLIGMVGCAGNPAKIEPLSAEFSTDPDKIADVVVILDPGSYKFKQIFWSIGMRDSAGELVMEPLTEGKHYKKDDNTITFLKEYLSGLPDGDNFFAFEMSGGSHPAFKLSVSIYEEDEVPEDNMDDAGTPTEDNSNNEDNSHWEDDNYADDEDDLED